MSDLTKKSDGYRTGLLCVIGCQLMWGFLPIYWNLLKPINSWVIIAYRIFTMLIFVLILARRQYSFRQIFEPLKDRKVRIKYFTAGLILTANWSIYIWAVNSGRVIQTSIGYFIEPLVICLFGILLFHEKLTKYNAIAMGMAVIAVLVILVHFRQIPAVALGLALTWSVYSAIKKTADQPVILSLFYETLIYAILSFFAILYLEIRGIGGLACHDPVKYGLLLLTGIATAVPVALFSVSAKKVPLFLIGLAQYISPSIILLCGIFVLNESIDRIQLLAFCIIWAGLVVYTLGELNTVRHESAVKDKKL